MNFTRRDTLILTGALSLASLAFGGAALAQDAITVDPAKLLEPKGLADHFLGPDDAKVAVIEYASPTCPHCATFHNVVYAEFKKEYIDTDKVRYTIRPFVRNVLDAVVFMLAEASGEANYYNVLSTYFKTQETWATSDNPREAILEIAKQLGFTEESFDAALTNQDLFAGMEALREQALDEFKLTGTPTFYINGKQLSGDKSLADLSAEIDPLLG